MRSGRTYEVFLNGNPLGIVGSTILSLSQRRVHGYTRKFGAAVELRLIREVPIPKGYNEEGYRFYLASCETFDIIRRKTWIEDGGRNIKSPLAQLLGLVQLTKNERRLLGKRVGQQNIKSGQIKRLALRKDWRFSTGQKMGLRYGAHQGRVNAESGLLKRNRTPEHQQKAAWASAHKRYHVTGRINSKCPYCSTASQT
jgi:hypothetical protein